MIRLRSSSSFPIVLPPSDDGVATTAIANVRAMVDAVGSRELSVRGARKVVQAAETVRVFTDAVEKIVGDTVAIARAGATCERDLAALQTEMDGFKTQQAKNAAERAEAEARRDAVGPAIRAELEGRELTATLRNTQLRQQIAALTVAAPAAVAKSTAPAGQAPRAPYSEVDDATLVRLSGEAQEIVRQVQAGNVPQSIRYPHHAFAACLYLRARLDGLDSRTAANHAREELVAHFLHGAELTGTQIRAFGREYLDLKKRLDANAASKQGTSALKAATLRRRLRRSAARCRMISGTQLAGATDDVPEPASLYLGTVSATGAPYTLPLDSLTRGVYVRGAIGSGKTSLLRLPMGNRYLLAEHRGSRQACAFLRRFCHGVFP